VSLQSGCCLSHIEICAEKLGNELNPGWKAKVEKERVSSSFSGTTRSQEQLHKVSLHFPLALSPVSDRTKVNIKAWVYQSKHISHSPPLVPPQPLRFLCGYYPSAGFLPCTCPLYHCKLAARSPHSPTPRSRKSCLLWSAVNPSPANIIHVP